MSTLFPLPIFPTNVFRYFWALISHVAPKYRHLERNGCGRKAVTECLPTLSDSAREAIRAKRTRSDDIPVSLAGTHDLWSSRDLRSFGDLNVFYINQDWQLHSNVDGIFELHGSHEGSNIALHLKVLLLTFSSISLFLASYRSFTSMRYSHSRRSFEQ